MQDVYNKDNEQSEPLMKKDPAKELFLKYSCNHFYMMKEGETQLYMELGGGDKKKEAQWRKEYIDNWISKLNTNDLIPLLAIQAAWAWEAIPAILAMEDHGDDYMKFWFAFTLERISEGKQANRGLRKDALKKARTLWIEILEDPSGITDDHRAEIDSGTLAIWKVTSPEEYLIKYTKSKLKEVNWGRGLDPEDIVDMDALWKI